MMSFILPLLVAAAPAAATFSPADTADAQCLAAFGMLASSKDQQMTQAGTMGSIYFYGKIIGRNPSADLAGLLRSIAQAVKKDPTTYLKRCGGEMETSGNALTEVGKTLAAEGL